MLVVYLFLCLFLIDLNCLTLMFNELPTKAKNNTLVSLGNLSQIGEVLKYLLTKLLLPYLC